MTILLIGAVVFYNKSKTKLKKVLTNIDMACIIKLQGKEKRTCKNNFKEEKEMSEEERVLSFWEYVDEMDPNCNLSDEELRLMYEFEYGENV